MQERQKDIQNTKDRLIKEQNKPPKIEYKTRIEQVECAKCEDCKKDSLDSLIKANHLKALSHRTMVYGLFMYSIFITILSAIKNKTLFADIRAFGIGIGLFFKTMFIDVKTGIIWVSKQADKIPQPIVAFLLHWIAIIVLTLIAVGAVVGLIYFIYIKFSEKIIKSIDNLSLGVILGVLAVIVFLGDILRTIIKFNLVWQYIIVVVLFFLARFLIEAYQENRGY